MGTSRGDDRSPSQLATFTLPPNVVGVLVEASASQYRFLGKGNAGFCSCFGGLAD
jgi:hypothetical protein